MIHEGQVDHISTGWAVGFDLRNGERLSSSQAQPAKHSQTGRLLGCYLVSLAIQT